MRSDTLQSFLNGFLAARQITTPNEDYPLYRYRITDSEFKTARKILHDSAKQGIGNRNWSAVFVLYAAEWWRCQYEGDRWKWEKIFDSLNINPQNLNVIQRNTLVETGLRYWRREVRKLNGSHRYFGTIAIEGGLPLNLLRQDNNWLSRVFKQVIPKYARLQHTGADAADLVGECEYIPKTFHNAQIHAVLGDMIATVVELKKKHQLQQRENPIGYLDQHDRDWREVFPLPINDDVGRKLLSDMIATAAKTDETLTLPIRSLRQLCDDGSVQLRLELARFIALEALGLEPEKIPGRLEIELVSRDGKSRLLGAALKTEYKQKPSLKMPRPPAAITGDAAQQGYSIRFKHLSETLKEIPLIGGERLDDDMPWVFTPRDDIWVLEGLASVSTRAKQAKILYPDHYGVDADYQPIATVLPNKKGISASGNICLTDNAGNIFVIKTAQERPSNYYYLEGKNLAFTSIPNEVYLGLPIFRYSDSETGVSKNIPVNKLLARAVNGKGAWQALSPLLQGVYEIRLCEQGAIVFRKKCVLLPEQFAVRFKPAANSLDGTIFLDCTGSAEVICETPIKHKITRENGGYRIDLFGEQTPPSQVRLTLHWQGMVEMVTLTLPFPARGGQIIDANGNKQPPKQRLFQDQLHGIRLRLFNEQLNHKRHLQIEFKLVDTTDNLNNIYFRDNVDKKGSVVELAIIDYLDWIKNLQAISRQLDSQVQLEVCENGYELLRIKVGRYSYSLERNLPQGTVELNANDHAQLPHDKLNGIELMAMRLSDPEQEHIKLEPHISEHTITGCWYFHPEKRDAEPWLIYPTKTSAVSLRPILWAVDYEPGNTYHLGTDISTLHSAVKIGQTQERHDNIRKVLKIMCRDFNHGGWDYLRQLWRQCPHLPLSSFDVWAIAVTDTEILAALALQMDEALIEKLNAELPIFWELVPLCDWQRAYKAYKEYLSQAIDENDLNGILSKRIDKISIVCHSLDVVSKLIKQLLCGKIDQELNVMKGLSSKHITGMINEERQKLDRRQADRHWPIAMQQEIVREWNKLEKSLQLGLKLDTISEHHHAAVALPILLAALCVKANTPTAWPGNAAAIFALKRLKSFDEEWFNVAFKWALAYYLSQPPFSVGDAQ